MSIQICAGLCVFVCDNLAFRGDLIALKRKHTSGLKLREELATAGLRFQEHFGRLVGEIATLKGRELRDIVPVRLLPGGIAGILRTEARGVRAAHDVVAPQHTHGRSERNADEHSASCDSIRRQDVRDVE